MGGLQGRRVVLGVSGGIAAYKAVDVCRRLVDAGAHVTPVMTEGATKFVGAATFSALASEPVRTSLWDSPEPIPHTRLGQTADLVLVAPATARVIGCYANGISDDLLTATLLATRALVVVCPAMHTEMWEHPAVQRNIEVLRGRGVHVVDPGIGRLAGGDEGPGRLAAPAMEDAVLALAGAADVVLMAAAVADFRPKAAASEKLKKADGVPEVLLETTTDILATLGERRPPGQTLVGFAAETGDVRAFAA